MGRENKGRILIVKRIIRVLALLCIIIVFCPAFMVSCSGEDMGISVMTAVGGVTLYGERLVNPHPIMLICLILPVLSLAISLIGKIPDKKKATSIAVCSGIDLVVWLLFKAAVKKAADDNYCDFQATGWYSLNILALGIVIALNALVIAGKLKMDSDIIDVVSKGGASGTINKMSNNIQRMSNAVSQMAENMESKKAEKVIGYCAKCGNQIVFGNLFCSTCGTAVPQSMIDKAEIKMREAASRNTENNQKETEGEYIQGGTDSRLFCQHCGAKLSADAIFCENCGVKII